MKARLFSRLLAPGLCLVSISVAGSTFTNDIVVFGATSAGIVAAVQAARMHASVMLMEPGNHAGGLTTGGLGATDIGNKAAIGGISREFYRRLGSVYGTRESWTFEPHVAEQVYFEMLREAGIKIQFGRRLEKVTRVKNRISSITTSTGDEFHGKIFIDATYEGDLMAGAGVSYHVGREANSTYGESLDGIRDQTPKHQFIVPVDPYRRAGDPASGLIPLVDPGDLGLPGAGDRRVQTYNYRLCFTTNAANRLPVEPPPNYDPARFELLGRYLQALVAAGKKPKLSEFWNPIWMPNGKTDINNNGPISTDYIGANYAYPEGTYATRDQIAREHELYTRGWITFLSTDPRVPEEMRVEMKRWGPCKDEFQDTGGWPRQLYVREARRMISSYVMTELNCRGQKTAGDSIGLAAYNMDSHNCRRIVRNGRVENEGDVQVPPMSPYPISYRTIVPKAGECENLLVPVCLSSSHIAYGSIRMEPVFMILGQSAATAARQAIDSNLPVQDIHYPALQSRLLADQQILAWTNSAPRARPPR